jgi:hypothetical protein
VSGAWHAAGKWLVSPLNQWEHAGQHAAGRNRCSLAGLEAKAKGVFYVGLRTRVATAARLVLSPAGLFGLMLDLPKTAR